VPDFKHVDSEAAERLMHLADRARAALIAAGIPAFDIMSPEALGGAAIEVDTGDDEGGGVYISWVLSRELTDEINNLLLTNQLSHERIQYSGKVRAAMRDAVIAILNAAGISARPAAGDMRALQVSISE
jgi:hypothetical protein